MYIGPDPKVWQKVPLAASTPSFFLESFEYSEDQQKVFNLNNGSGGKTTYVEKSANNEGKFANNEKSSIDDNNAEKSATNEKSANEFGAAANYEDILEDDAANNEVSDDGSAIPTPDTRHGHAKYS